MLHYDVNAPFTSLNPMVVDFSGSNNIFPLLYSYLFTPNADGVLEPDLAVRWVYNPDKLTWTINLRDDAVFHNGQRVTTKDVKHSYEKWLNSRFPELNSDIDRISLLNDTAISLHLKKEAPAILNKIWYFEIIPHSDTGRIDYFQHPVGSGPFRFSSRKGEKEIHLEADGNYYGGRPSLDRIVFHYQPDRERAWTRLLAGQTDIVQEISAKNYEIARQYEDRFHFDRYTLPYITILLYNTHDPIFSDARVRMALSLAIDREYIVIEILGGFGKVATGPMGVDSPYRNPDVTQVPYDPEKALTLLSEAGWFPSNEDHHLYKDGQAFAFTLLVFSESQIEKRVAQYIRLCLNEIGIKATIEELPSEVIKQRYYKNTEFQAVLTEIEGVYDVFSYERLETNWSPLAGRKAVAGGFGHPKVTRLLKKISAERDTSRRIALLHKTDALIASLHPGTFLFQKTAIDVMSKRFDLPYPFQLNHAGIYRLKHAALKRK